MEDDIRLVPARDSWYVDNNGQMSKYINGEWRVIERAEGALIFDSYYVLAEGSVAMINDVPYKVEYNIASCKQCDLCSTGSDLCNLTHCHASSRADGKSIVLKQIEE